MSAWSMYQCCSQLALQSREPDFVLFPHFQLHASLWMAPPSRHLHTANSTGTLLENSRRALAEVLLSATRLQPHLDGRKMDVGEQVLASLWKHKTRKLFTAASLRHFPQDSHASCAWTCCCCLAWLPILMARLPRSIAALSTTTCSQPSLSHVPADASAVPEPTASSGAYLRRGDMGHISPFAGSLALGIRIQSCSNTLPLLYITSTW